MKKLMLAGAMAFGLSSFAQADLIATDWKQAGDGLAAYDTFTGLEWLGLDQSVNYSLFDMETETQAGGQFEGWRIATYEEVDQLIHGYFDLGAMNLDYTINGNSSDEVSFQVSALNAQFIDHFQSGSGKSLGFFYDAEGDVVKSGVRSGDKLRHFFGDFSSTKSSNDNGLFLVSDGGVTLSSIQDPTLGGLRQEAAPVPLPATAFLLSLGGLAFLRKTKKAH